VPIGGLQGIQVFPLEPFLSGVRKPNISIS
jgi:hypothetical protein